MVPDYNETYEKNFEKLRSQQEFIEDASRKSSIDAHCRDMCNELNDTENYFTTSSCSGRFLAFAQNEIHVKKNCDWIKVTHDPLDEDQIKEFVELIQNEQSKYDQIYLKFEPFILHVCCRNLHFAKLMLEQAIGSGYRNSGIMMGKSQLTLAIRSTQNMETPISCDGKLIVDNKYIEYVCQKANTKFEENFERINRLYENLRSTCFQLGKDGTSNLKAKDVKKNEKAQMRAEKREYYQKLKESGELTNGNDRNNNKNSGARNCDDLDDLLEKDQLNKKS